MTYQKLVLHHQGTLTFMYDHLFNLMRGHRYAHFNGFCSRSLIWQNEYTALFMSVEAAICRVIITI